MDNRNVETLILDKDLDEKYQNEKNKINNYVKKRRILKKLIYFIILIVSFGTFLFSGYKIVVWLIENYQTNKATTAIKKITNITNDDEGLLNVDFENLSKENSDVVAWIKVKNTKVDYPVVQADDNKYYLYRSFDKNSNSAGWIFSDYRNNFSDLNNNTIIYGHGRLDGSMFGSLRDLFEDSWLNNKDNYLIDISTPEYNSKWQVFSIYYIKSESYYIQTEFVDDNAYQEFIDTITKRSLYNFNTTLNTEDKILTLSTCKNDYGDRIVIHAKLVQKEIKN